MLLPAVRVQKLALTGGPGGGKTKLAKFVAKKAAAKGYFPFIVPEAATLLMNSGLSPHGGLSNLLWFQRAVFEETTFREELYERMLLASRHPKPLLVCDRGIPDIRAYISEEEYFALLQEYGITHPTGLRDERYSAVVYMRTAAIGAEKHYSNKSNKVRSEDIASAKELDRRTLYAWLGHPKLMIIENAYGSFREKLEAGWRAACFLLNL